MPNLPPTADTITVSKYRSHVINPTPLSPSLINKAINIIKSIKHRPLTAPDNKPSVLLNRAAAIPPARALRYSAVNPRGAINASGSCLV